MGENVKIIAQNKKARFNYFIEESYECGLELEGTEVKSVKAGNVSFADSFAEIINGEVFPNINILPCSITIRTEKNGFFSTKKK